MMRRICLTIFVCLLTVVAVAQKKQLVILHTNDTHSCVMPLNPNLADSALAGRGGFLRRMALIEDERAKAPGLLLIDSGDFSQGSPYYNFYKGEVEVELMNRMGYDVATIGNHEFDFGLENMARIFRMAKFPIVCANYDFTGTSVEGLVKPYTIIKRNGLKIGLFGLSPQPKGLVDTTKFVGVKYLDPVETARRMAALLKTKKRCDVIICVSHLGWEDEELTDQMLVPATRDIDIVLGGHSHTYMKTLRYVKNVDGKDVPVDQNGKHGIWIGRIVLDLEKGE